MKEWRILGTQWLVVCVCVCVCECVSVFGAKGVIAGFNDEM